jgi:tetratricopeptide (TPR) repeat protein
MIRLIGSIILLMLVASPVFSQKKKKNKKGKTEVVEVDKNRVMRLIFDGERQELLDNPIKAASYYQECINIDPDNSVCLFKLASVYYLSGNYSGSENLIKRAIEIDATNKWYFLLLSHSYVALGDLNNATLAFKKAIELDPYKPDYQIELAGLYAKQGKYKEAIALLDEFEEKHGLIPDLNIRKQNLYVLNGQTNKAIIECLLLVNAFPEEQNYYGLLAELYFQNNQPENALLAFEDLLEINPDNGLAHYSLSKYYRENGEINKADAEILLAMQSSDLEIESKIDILNFYSNDLDNDPSLWPYIKQMLDALETANPGDAKAYAILSDFYNRLGELEKARGYIYKSLEIEKDKFQVWNQLIILDSELQDWEAMIEDGKAALELFPSNPAFYYFLGIAYSQNKNYQDAIEILETGKMMIFKNEGGLVDFQMLLGDVYNSTGQHDKSDDYYDKVLKTQPDNIYVLNNYSYYLSLRKEHLEKAKKMAKKAVELAPDQYNYQDTYGWVLFQNGDYEESVTWLKKSVDNGGSVNGEILEHYGDALFMTGKKEKALEIWKLAKSVGDASDLIDSKIENQNIPDIN